MCVAHTHFGGHIVILTQECHFSLIYFIFMLAFICMSCSVSRSIILSTLPLSADNVAVCGQNNTSTCTM